MTGIEIMLLIMGLVFTLGSFFLGEKFSENDTKELAKESKAQINVVLDKELSELESRVNTIVENVIDQSLETTIRKLEKETNEKIMAISEYSDGVLEQIKSTHEEVMFLYSMLNDKHDELVQYANKLVIIERQLSNLNNEVNDSVEQLNKRGSNGIKQEEILYAKKSDSDDMRNYSNEETVTSDLVIAKVDDRNHNEEILRCYEAGDNPIDIARTLGIGTGEVKLVIDLLRRDVADEA